LEQEAVGKLERQKLDDARESEKLKLELTKLKNETAAVESTGQAKAEAKAKAESKIIEAVSNVKKTKLDVEANNIKEHADLENLKKQQTQELEYLKNEIHIEIDFKTKIENIETSKTVNMINSIGKDTIQIMSKSGVENQAKLLEGLGLQSFLITDGNTNLFKTANSMTGKNYTKKHEKKHDVGTIEEIEEEYSYDEEKSFEVLNE